MRRVLLMGLSVAVLLGAAAGQSTTPADDRPTLADLAAKQKKAKSAKKVITNEDIPERADNTSSTASSSAGASSGSASAASGSGAAADEKPGKDKAAKGEKAADPEAVAAAQTKVDNLKHDEEAMTNGVKKIEDLIANGDDFLKNSMADTLQHQKDNLAETKAKRQTAESALDKLKRPPKP